MYRKCLPCEEAQQLMPCTMQSSPDKLPGPAIHGRNLLQWRLLSSLGKGWYMRVVTCTSCSPQSHISKLMTTHIFVQTLHVLICRHQKVSSLRIQYRDENREEKTFALSLHHRRVLRQLLRTWIKTEINYSCGQKGMLSRSSTKMTRGALVQEI